MSAEVLTSYNAGVLAAPPTPSGFPVPDDAAINSLAPDGVLRAGINMSNFLLVNGTSANGDPIGLSPSMAAALASALSVPLELVTFPGPAALVDTLATDELDIGNVGADPTRAEHVVFTAPYCEIEATYLVRGDSLIATIEDVDQSDVRIASKRNTAYTLWLDRNIMHAEVIHTDSLDESLEVFVANDLEVMAGLRPRLLDDAERVRGSRLLGGRFTSVLQAIGTHRDREPDGMAYLERFVRWAVDSGFVIEVIEHYAVKGLSLPTAPTG